MLASRKGLRDPRWESSLAIAAVNSTSILTPEVMPFGRGGKVVDKVDKVEESARAEWKRWIEGRRRESIVVAAVRIQGAILFICALCKLIEREESRRRRSERS